MYANQPSEGNRIALKEVKRSIVKALAKRKRCEVAAKPLSTSSGFFKISRPEHQECKNLDGDAILISPEEEATREGC